MAELLENKCKNCGSALDVRLAVNGVVTCPYCYTPWTVPKETSPAALQFLRMGEHDLDACKFDDAFVAFQKASELAPQEPEAYFGMAIAQFKVQYLKDHVNNKMQPICHEATENQFTDDVNYLRALLKATAQQREIYEKRGAEIDYILGEFFKLKKEKVQYDCFICVKVTDDTTKQPTEDSKDADYIYRLLQNKGYKPFYSERELRNVTGADYEARILYALWTSECMLLVCREEKYLQTPWVKNEYTRFLKLVNDEEKESDSITIVFNGKPIERLPGRNGKLQGIDFALRESDGQILDFVEKHTPAARKKKEEEEKRKKAEEEARIHTFEEQQKLIEEQRKELDRLRMQQGSSPALYGSNLLDAIRKAQQEEETQKHEAQVRQSLISRIAALLNTELLKSLELETKGTTVVGYTGEDDTLIIPSGITKIAANAFENKNIKCAIFPNSLSEIEARAFFGCGSLTSVSFGSGLKRIGDEAFSFCSSLQSVVLPKALKRLGTGVFSACDNLQSLKIDEGNPDFIIRNNCIIAKGEKILLASGAGAKIPDDGSVREIAERAFAYHRDLTELVVPEGITVIQKKAFQGCVSLRKIILPASIKTVASGAFMIDGDIEGEDSHLEEIHVNQGSSSFYVNKTCLIDLQKQELILGCKNSQIPYGVVSIAAYAFSGCNELTSVTIPANVREIGEYAFFGCDRLKSIIIPRSVEKVGYYAFSHTGIENIYCESVEKPSGWDSDWNNAYTYKSMKKQVVWGYRS